MLTPPVPTSTVVEGSRRLLPYGAAAASGLALTCAFAPLALWPLAVLSPALLMWLWGRAATPRAAAWLGFWHGVATFAAGTWWLYISLHGFGGAPIALALLLLAALVLLMAAYYAALGYALKRYLPCDTAWATLLAMPCAWLLTEWLRGWFLSGFPWLSLGYSQTDTPLAGLAPVGGVYLVSAAVLLSAGGLVTTLRGRGAARVLGLLALLLPWAGGAVLDRQEWTTSAADATTVAIVQGAVPQDLKWQDDHHDATLALYQRLNAQALGADIVVWPEAALPDLANNLNDYLANLARAAAAAHSSVLLGVVRVADDGQTYYNSLLSLSGNFALYDKQHLVPFGEYFPVPAFVRSWLRLLSLPYSDFTPGAPRQPPLPAGRLQAAASICYEDAFAQALRSAARSSDLLVNVTNDAWFGKAGARYQHLQIARMRSIEARRFQLRAANDGISAIIDPRGRVLATAPNFEPAVLRGQITARRGDTPYLVWGDAPILLVAALGLALALLKRRRPAPM